MTKALHSFSCCLVTILLVTAGSHDVRGQVRRIGTTFEGRTIHAVAHQANEYGQDVPAPAEDMYVDPFADDPVPDPTQVAPESVVTGTVDPCSRAACGDTRCTDPACEGCEVRPRWAMSNLGSCLHGELGEPWSLSDIRRRDCPPCMDVGGWMAAGYHTKGNDLFNSRPNQVAFHQSWLYAEKVADACESPFGFRVDVMYGIDADDTQAFGNPPGSWDFLNGFDYGAYGWAIPQLYGELAVGAWSIKAGHFFTLVGYEVVPAPDNFFYSHAMTMYNSEPFTHTGVLGTRSVNDQLEVYVGWTLGWDTGFDALNDGSSWLGGARYAFSEDASLTYISTAGNIGQRGTDAYSHSVLLDLSVTDQLTWVIQSDLLRVDSTGEDTIGLNQYFFYELSDCLSLGTRLEWWKGDVLVDYAPHGATLPAAGTLSYYEATFGANLRPHANLVFRPEVRVDWSPAADYDTTYFGIDTIFTF